MAGEAVTFLGLKGDLLACINVCWIVVRSKYNPAG
jgi:hypothetical protein